MKSHEGGACLLAGLPAYLGLSHFGSVQTSACPWPMAEDAEAEHLGVPSCSTTCSICQAHGGFSCPGCSLHFGVSDHQQHKKVEALADEKVYFVLDAGTARNPALATVSQSSEEAAET